MFASMLDSGAAPSSLLRNADLNSETSERILEFIYTGDFLNDPPSDDMMIELLQCAHKYEISSLKMEVLSRMSVTLSIDNAIRFVQAVKTHAAGDDGDKVVMHMRQFCKRY